jgi:hypothetical protein
MKFNAGDKVRHVSGPVLGTVLKDPAPSAPFDIEGDTSKYVLIRWDDQDGPRTESNLRDNVVLVQPTPLVEPGKEDGIKEEEVVVSKPLTQREHLAILRDYALDLGAVANVRKNSYGEYEARVKMNGEREPYVAFESTFSDAYDTVKAMLDEIAKRQRAEGERREREYQHELDKAYEQARTIMGFVNCTVTRDGETVTFHSPKTGSHSLCMALGVRPVSDLIAHACGFAEQQTH